MKPIDAWWRYSYSPTVITVEHNSGVSGKNQRAVYYMSKEHADSSIVMVGEDTVRFTEFVYDNNGYMTSVISDHSISVIPELKQVWKNGNLQEHIDYDNGNEYDRTYYEYYEDIPNKPHAFTFGPQLNGKTSKNLLKRMVIVRNFNDTSSVLLHRYQFDSKGRITTNAIYGKSGELADSLEYFY